MSKYTIQIEKLHQGEQLRSYGPHTWEAYLTFSSDPENPIKYGTREWEVKHLIPSLVHPFIEGNDGSMNDHFSPHITIFEQVSPGRWHVVIEEPFTD